MNIRIRIESGVVTDVYLAPSTMDKVQILDKDAQEIGAEFTSFLEVQIKKEIDFSNPLEFE